MTVHVRTVVPSTDTSPSPYARCSTPRYMFLVVSNKEQEQTEQSPSPVEVWVGFQARLTVSRTLTAHLLGSLVPESPVIPQSTHFHGMTPGNLPHRARQRRTSSKRQLTPSSIPPPLHAVRRASTVPHPSFLPRTSSALGLNSTEPQHLALSCRRRYHAHQLPCAGGKHDPSRSRSTTRLSRNGK